MKLSEVKVGGVVHIASKYGPSGKGIVVSRCPEDRTSGVTVVAFEDGGRHDYVWDHQNPEVVLLGTGKLITRIEIDS